MSYTSLVCRCHLYAFSALLAVQEERPAKEPIILNITCKVAFQYGMLRLNGIVSENLLTLLIQDLKR